MHLRHWEGHGGHHWAAWLGDEAQEVVEEEVRVGGTTRSFRMELHRKPWPHRSVFFVLQILDLLKKPPKNKN